MHDKFYEIHKINNPNGKGDGGFTEGMLLVIFFDQGGGIPPQFEPWMYRADQTYNDHSLNSEGHQRHADHQQIEKIKVVPAESPLVEKRTIRGHLTKQA